MGLLQRVSSARMLAQQARDPSNDFWFQGVPFVGGGSVPMNPDLAMTLSAVWKGVRIISETIGSIPCFMYERLPRGRKKAEQHPLYELLSAQPNRVQTALEFWEMGLGHLLLRGNFYNEILEGPRGFADQLVPIHPDRMTPERLPSGGVGYVRRMPDGQTKTYTQDEIFHVRGLSTDGLKGVSVIEYGASSLGVGLAAQGFAGRFFRSGAAPAFAAIHPGPLGEEGLTNLRQSINAYTNGSANAHGVLVLEEGMEIKALGVKPEEAQMLATQNHSVREVARWLNLPSTMLGDEATKTYASQEAFQQELVDYTFRPWCVRIEQAIRRDLILAVDRFYARFMLAALLRGDTRSRYEAHRIGIMSGFETRNEARELEDWNPGPPELDEFMAPMNMATPTSTTPASPNGGGQADHGFADRALQSLPDRAARIVQEAAAGLVRKEIAAVSKAAGRFAKDGAGWQTWLREFYDDHAGHVAERLRLPVGEAREYAARQGEQLAERGVAAMADWEWTATEALVALAVGDPSAPARVTAERPAAIHVQLLPAPPPIVQRTVERDAAGRITRVLEAHEPTGDAPARLVTRTVTRDAHGRISAVSDALQEN